MTITAVQSILNSKLAAFAAAQSPALTIAYENKPYTPSTPPVPYLRCYLLPATPRAAALGISAQDVVRGIFQVDVLGIPNTGWGATTAIADKLRTHFSRWLRIEGTGANAGTSVICESTAIFPATTEDTRYKISVSITFSAYMNPA